MQISNHVRLELKIDLIDGDQSSWEGGPLTRLATSGQLMAFLGFPMAFQCSPLRMLVLLKVIF